MINAILLHGKPTQERYENPEMPKPHEANWFPWLASLLADSGISTAIPHLPRPYFPVYDDYKLVFEELAITENTGVAAHSAGAEFALRWLGENDEAQLERLVMVAPYHDDAGKYGDFSNYELDPGIAERVGRITIFNSTDDSPGIQANVAKLMGVFPAANLVEFEGYGHFMLGNNMVSPEFPELYDELFR